MGEQLAVIDWELALYGDPLHDLATHLVRMQYDESEHELMVGLWAEAMSKAGRADVTEGMDRDLRGYLGFEYVQSVFPDVMRAALSLPDAPEAADYMHAAGRVCEALRRAWEPLRLPGTPVDESKAAEALYRWHDEHGAARTDPPVGLFARFGGRSVDRWCEGADQPRETSRRLRRVRERETTVEMERRLEGLERHGC
jgi:hypothetical protein